MRSFSLVLFVLVGASFGLNMNCPSDGQHFFAHPTRCDKFVECKDGVAAEVDCIEGLIFNPNAGHCDFPANYPCENKPEEGPVGTCPEINGEFVDFLTDAARCDVFYMCNWGVAIQRECPPGLHFNPTLWVCDYPYRAGCTAAQHFL